MRSLLETNLETPKTRTRYNLCRTEILLDCFFVYLDSILHNRNTVKDGDSIIDGSIRLPSLTQSAA